MHSDWAKPLMELTSGEEETLNGARGKTHMVYSCDGDDCRKLGRIRLSRPGKEDRTDGECKVLAVAHGWYFGKWGIFCPGHAPKGGEEPNFLFGHKESKYNTKQQRMKRDSATEMRIEREK